LGVDFSIEEAERCAVEPSRSGGNLYRPDGSFTNW